MNNGEGTSENVAKVAFPDPSDKSDCGDVSPASSSQYSSCGESEFERYCSANSVMGTPSMRSSYGASLNDGLDSEFGSLTSLGFGDDLSLENFSLGGNRKISTLGDRRIEFRGGRNDEDDNDDNEGLHDDEDMNVNGRGMVSEDKVEMVSGIENVLIRENGGNGESGQRNLVVSDEVGDSVEIEPRSEEGRCSERLDLHFGLEFDRREVERVEDKVEGMEDETSSRNEHSEGEDSMYNYGNEEEHSSNLYYPRNMERFQEEKRENENPLLMNLNVAFGSKDWDDFEQELGGSTVSSLTLERFPERGESNVESGKNLFGLTSNSSFGFPSGGLKEQGSDVTDASAISKKFPDAGECKETINHSTETQGGVSYSVEQGHVEEEKDIPVDNYQVQDADLRAENTKSFSPYPIILQKFSGPHQGARDYSAACNQVEGTDLLEESTKRSLSTPSCLPKPSGSYQYSRDVSVVSNEVQGARDLTMLHNNSSVGDFFELEQDPLAEIPPLEKGLEIIDSRMEKKQEHVNNKETSTDDCGVSDNQQFAYVKPQLEPLADFSVEHLCSKSLGFPEMSNAKLFEQFGDVKGQLEPLADFSVDQHCSESMVFPEQSNMELFDDGESKLSLSTLGNVADASNNSVAPMDLMEEHPTSTMRWNLELNNYYDDIVHEMEEILLDYNESPGTRFSQHQMSQSLLSLPPRDGGSTASTSGADDAYPLTPLPLRIDWVEVVGAKQKKGNVSLSERLVGVKEYTVYKLKVWSGKDQWEVERRYRDFFTLYRRLKSLFVEQGRSLPSPWSSVEKESLKLFGNASPDVVAHRSVLIQECLQSVLYSSPPNALIRFLSPEESLPSSPASKTLVSGSTSFTRGTDAEKNSTLGKTISLIVEIRPQKSMKQMLEVQHYTCAGCHKHFDDGMTLMQDFVQTFGWGKPRLCEYTGQLFCSSCHTNETAVLPARVLHHWDFTQYPVSQLAKSYLDSVYDQPMLCVSAVNPFLYSKVPTLHHVMGVRKKIGIMLPYVRCPFRRSINRGLGSRRYLLESNDFFALRDLIDLSKGPFAALPVMVENVSRKIQEHITEQCLVCCDVGVPCSARQACDDPSSLIFAFQEGEIERCKSCQAVFHKPCFRKLTCCPCGASLGLDEAANSSKRASNKPIIEANGALNTLGRRSSSRLSIGLLSGLFSKANTEKTERRGSNNVILMGSLPNTYL